MARIDCFRCKYFHITWDQQQPRGCKAYGFKTAKLPSIVVKETSGSECSMYTPKGAGKIEDATKVDLNDKKNW